MASPHRNGVRVTGRVVRIVREKGFGFIRADRPPVVEYFFHRSACGDAWDTLCEHQPVSFLAADGAKGPRAELIEILG
jgi:cold shock protein